MEAHDIGRQHETRIIIWATVVSCLVTLPATALRAWNGEPIALELWALASGATMIALWAAHRTQLLHRFRSLWITLSVAVAGAGLWWTGNYSVGAFLLVAIMPLVAVMVHSPRAGAYTALGCWAALLLPLVWPRQALLVDPTLILVGAGAATTLWAFGAYLETSRAQALAQATRLAERLERNEARFRSYAEHGRDLITEFDETGHVMYMSPGHEALLGRPPGSFTSGAIGGDLSIHPDDHLDLIRYFEEVRGGDRSGYCTVRYRRPDGELRWLHLRGSQYKNEDGEMRVVIRAHDETEQRLAADERETLVGELQDALDNVKALKGIIPICASCKKIRRPDGSWEALEVYLSENSEADLSHGLCQGCLADVDI